MLMQGGCVPAVTQYFLRHTCLFPAPALLMAPAIKPPRARMGLAGPHLQLHFQLAACVHAIRTTKLCVAGLQGRGGEW